VGLGAGVRGDDVDAGDDVGLVQLRRRAELTPIGRHRRAQRLRGELRGKGVGEPEGCRREGGPERDSLTTEAAGFFSGNLRCRTGQSSPEDRMSDRAVAVLCIST
jgi:hypothetical protein